MNSYKIALELLKDNLESIPINYYKRPKLKFKDIPITEEFIKENRNSYESASGLALLCRGVWCIDIDVNHGSENGFESLKELEDVWPDIVRNGQQTYVQTTPRGGKHMVFKKVEGIDYKQHIGYLSGIDIKAQDNNFFIFAGSVTSAGTYTHNNKEIQYFDGTYIDYFDGTFEDRIFSSSGNYDDQTLEKYSVRNRMKNYQYANRVFSTLDGKGGLGKQAYQRILDGTSEQRNNDLFLASTFAKECDVSLEPLKVLIGDVRNGDEFTESEWFATVTSAGVK